MNKLFSIIREEFKMTAANKSFIILTIIGPFLIAALSILPGILAGKTVVPDKEYKVGIHAQDKEVISILSRGLRKEKIILESGVNQEELREKVKSGEIEGLLIIPDDYLHEKVFTYYSKTGTDVFVSEAIQGILGEIIVSKRLADEGLDPVKIAALTARPIVKVTKINEEGKAENQGFLELILISLTFVMMLYMTILLYGQSIARSVLTEKTSKTVEIMLSSVRPLTLMFGKIIGKGLAGLLQYGIWVSIAILIVRFIGPRFGIAIPSSLTVTNFIYLFVFFFLAFFLYSSIYAALGSASEDEQHLTQLAWPVLVFLIIPMVMISSFVMNPDSSTSVFFSLFPLTAPLVMLIRVLVSAPSLSELILCFGILIVSIGLAVILSAKIFRVGILMTGKKFNFKQILTWLWR